MKIRISTLMIGLGVYLLSSGFSLAFFNSVMKPSRGDVRTPLSKVSPSAKPKYKVDPSIPRDQACPLNGLKFTKQEKDIWDKRRPLAVMIENSEDARPQSGLSRADIVYETLAEGWVTRFMAVYFCNTPMENITFAPVRSARTYYLDWVSEYDALYNHVGGAGRCPDETVDPRAKALCQIDTYGIKDLDQFGIGYPDCYRNPDRLDRPVATEHTMVCFSENLYKIAEKREWTNVDERGIAWNKNFKEWKFKEEAPSSESNASNIKIVFASGKENYDAGWEYDPLINSYKRKTGGVPHKDLESGEQLTAKNVIVQFSKITGPVDDHGHILYQTIGSGKAIIFQDGKAIVGTWQKKNRIGRTVFYGPGGSEIELNPGMVWIELVPSEELVTYQ